MVGNHDVVNVRADDIVRSYMDILSSGYNLSVEQYLLIRSQAVAEIGNGFIGLRSDIPVPQNKNAVKEEVECKQDTVISNTPTNRYTSDAAPKTKAVASEVKPLHSMASEDDDMNPVADNEDLDDFAILKGIKDNWN